MMALTETVQTKVLENGFSLQTKVLENVNVVSKMLQAEDTDLHRAVSPLKDIIEVLSGFPQDSVNAKVTAKTLADKRGAQNAFEDTRRRKARCHFDVLCEDERLSSGESSFRVNNFNAKIDIVIHQLSNRFKSLRATSSLTPSIPPTTLVNADDDALYETAGLTG